MAKKPIVRWMLSVAGVVLVIMAIGIGIIAKDLIGLTKSANGTVLSGGTELATSGFGNIFLLPAGPGQIALVDCGMDAQAKVIVAALKARGLSNDSVKAIFITHGHFDHIGGCGMFPRARIMAMSPDVGMIEGTAKVHSPMMNLIPQSLKPTGLKVTHILRDGEVVTLGPLTVRAFAVPGHTPGSAAYLARGTLFLGDTASMTSSGDLRNTVWAFATDARQARQSFKALIARLARENMTVRAVAPAHSAPGPGSALARFAARNE